MTKAHRRDWAPILREAERIVHGYPYRITLRQLHYRLLSVPTLGYGSAAKDIDYLSQRTADLRRRGSFPDLADETRSIEVTPSWASPAEALAAIAQQYRRDRTEGQSNFIVLGGEKRAMLVQFRQWYPDLGVPFIALSGNASQTYVDEVADFVDDDGRKSVLLYVGDLDASGEDIERDFVKRCPVWDHVERIAVKESQITELGLPKNPGNPNDPKRKPFIDTHGSLFQVEVEAIAPNELHRLYDEALAQWWDRSTWNRVVEAEAAERRQLEALARKTRTP
jgi:hypothetical protein